MNLSDEGSTSDDDDGVNSLVGGLMEDDDIDDDDMDDDDDDDAALPQPPAMGGLVAGTFSASNARLTHTDSGSGNAGNVSPMSSLSGGDARSTSYSSHAIRSQLTNGSSAPPLGAPVPFRLAAPQILDEEDSDLDLEEQQLPSQPFVLSENGEQASSAHFSMKSSSSNGRQIYDEYTDTLVDHSGSNIPEAARRGSGVRRSRRISHAWGELAHDSNVNGMIGGGQRPSVLLSELVGAAGFASSGTMEGSTFLKAPFPSTNSQAEFRSGEFSQDSFDSNPDKSPVKSKILERMKQGIMQASTMNITEYHDASTRTGSGRPKYSVNVDEQRRQQEQFQRQLVYCIGLVICGLLIAVIVTVVVLLLQNFNNNNESAAGQPLPLLPTASPTVTEPSGMPTASPTTSAPSASPSVAPTMANPLDTLDSIAARGLLNCGISEGAGMAYRNENNEWQGMDVDWCRALAAGILGDSSLVSFLPVSQSTRFPTLHSGAIDVLAASTTFTMQRNVFEATTQTGFSFTSPYLYNGMGFGGDPLYVECAQDQDWTTVQSGKNCTALSICVLDSTTHETVVRQLLPNVTIVSKSSNAEMYAAIGKGDCQVLAGEPFQIAEPVVTAAANLDFNYTIGSEVYSKEPLALVTRNDDAKWSDYCQWILQALMFAEQQGIDDSMAEAMPVTSSFGSNYTRSYIQAVQAVGNYGQVYRRHLEDIVPRQTINRLNQAETTGLLYSLPLGDLEIVGPGPSGILDTISNRGFLRCGITRRPVFAEFNTDTQEWEGMEINLCKAISAAIFDGIFSTIEYVDESATELTVSLDRGDIDLVARLTPITLDEDVQDATSGVGHSFSPPLFYDKLSFGGIPPYVDCANSLNFQEDPCQDVLICVVDGTLFGQQAAALIPTRFLVTKETAAEAVQGLRSGQCNVVALGTIDVSADSVQANGYQGSYETTANDLPLPRVPMALMTRQEDPQWSAYCFWIANALVLAEELRLGKATSDDMPLVDLFGRVNYRIFRDAIGATGAWSEWFGGDSGGLNALNTNPLGPQLHPYPGL